MRWACRSACNRRCTPEKASLSLKARGLGMLMAGIPGVLAEYGAGVVSNRPETGLFGMMVCLVGCWKVMPSLQRPGCA